MNLAIYIHWPFCVSKCPYCDFNSHVGDTRNQAKWRQTYKRELEYYSQILPDRLITSIFFGGGTPSLMEPRTVESVIQDIRRLWPMDKNVEITLEANPSSSEAEQFIDLRSAGINRLSLGIQSFDEKTLKFLGRAHNSAEARKAIELASKIFSRFSFDLIYAHRDQTPILWEKELCEALSIVGDHLSLYQLTIEPHTQFYVRAKRGESLTAQDDHAVAMYEMTQEIMDKASLPAYEISNHSKKGQESRHNLSYWHYDDYIGIGPGAHGRYRDHVHRHGTENHRAPDTWLQEVTNRGTGLKVDTILDAPTAMSEAVMMGLRLASGVNLVEWKKKFKLPINDFLPDEKLKRLMAEGYVIQDEKSLYATRTGLQRLNAILNYLV